MIDRRMRYFIYKPPHQFTWKTLPQTDAIVCKLVLQTVCLNISWAVVIFHLCKRTTKTNPLFAGRYIVRETSMLVEKYYKIEFISNDFKNCYAKIIYVGIEPKFSYWHQTVSAMRHGGYLLLWVPVSAPLSTLACAYDNQRVGHFWVTTQNMANTMVRNSLSPPLVWMFTAASSGFCCLSTTSQPLGVSTTWGTES